jgi:hypothetical protein
MDWYGRCKYATRLRYNLFEFGIWTVGSSVVRFLWLLPVLWTAPQSGYTSARFPKCRTASDPSLPWSVNNLLIALRFMFPADY